MSSFAAGQALPFPSWRALRFAECSRAPGSPDLSCGQQLMSAGESMR